ncbi:hypothetical protein HRbin11_02434 [bacterium HR11]|nr:hypothetical protein HRbin11_02434 [bacterium HR11]
MRIRVELHFPTPVVLPWSYLDWLQGLLYEAMRRGLPRVARRVHDVGFPSEGKRYKLLTFSLLSPARYRRVADGLWVEDSASWWVSSPVGDLIEAVALGLLRDPGVRLGPHTAVVERVEVEPPPAWAETMVWRTLSPVCVSTGRMEGGRLRKIFVPPHDPAFERILRDNLRRKAQALGEAVPDGELGVEWLAQPVSKLLTVHDVQVRGWMGTLRVVGPPALLRVGYEAGLGERNAQGFGMVGLAASSP